MKPTQVSRTPPPSAGRELPASSLWGREVQEHPQRLSQTSLCAPGLGAWDSRTLSFLFGGTQPKGAASSGTGPAVRVCGWPAASSPQRAGHLISLHPH